jgi:hypothetical protein
LFAEGGAEMQQSDAGIWIVGLMSTLCLTYMGVLWVVVNFLG